VDRRTIDSTVFAAAALVTGFSAVIASSAPDQDEAVAKRADDRARLGRRALADALRLPAPLALVNGEPGRAGADDDDGM
jgi:hypothetical protein